MIAMPEPFTPAMPVPGVPDPKSPPETWLWAAWVKAVGPDLAGIMIPQFPIPGTKFQADFGIPMVQIIVEVDGNEFHSSREDRQKDYRRERAVIELSWLPLRFTGVDIYRGADYCADQIWRVVMLRVTEIAQVMTWRDGADRDDFTLGA
jgi:very-short-patch-repair endonuclease